MDGKTLRLQRKEMGLTQKELGDLLGVAGNTIARWERNEVPSPPFLYRALNDVRRELAEQDPKD